MVVKRAKTSRRAGSAVSKAPAAKARGLKTQARKGQSLKGKSVGRKTASKKAAAPPPANVLRIRPLVQVVEGALDEMKAVNVRVLDVHKLTDIADTMVIASGNSDRHVRSIADRIVEHAKKAGFRPMGIEGERDGEWVLVDLHDVIVHIMLPRVREFYRLESLWDVSAARREATERTA
jgi:ribosome-associated protein